VPCRFRLIQHLPDPNPTNPSGHFPLDGVSLPVPENGSTYWRKHRKAPRFGTGVLRMDEGIDHRFARVFILEEDAALDRHNALVHLVR
jgi:hypothetical protein